MLFQLICCAGLICALLHNGVRISNLWLTCLRRQSEKNCYNCDITCMLSKIFYSWRRVAMNFLVVCILVRFVEQWQTSQCFCQWQYGHWSTGQLVSTLLNSTYLLSLNLLEVTGSSVKYHTVLLRLTIQNVSKFCRLSISLIGRNNGSAITSKAS